MKEKNMVKPEMERPKRSRKGVAKAGKPVELSGAQDLHIRLLAKTYHDFETVEGLATVVTNEAIREQKNSLAVNRYVKCSKDTSTELDLQGAYDTWCHASQVMDATVAEFVKFV